MVHMILEFWRFWCSFKLARTSKTPGPQLEDRIVAELERDSPIARDALRSMLRVNNQRFGQALATLVSSGSIVPTPAGLTLARS